MIKGGYIIADCKDIDIKTDSGATIPGLHATIEGAHRKAVLLSGVTLDGVEKGNCLVCPEISDGSYTFTAHGKTFTVTASDAVTIA